MDADHRVITIDRHEWVLRQPAHHTEVEKAVVVAEHERAALASRGTRTGDVHIHGDDTELVISFEAERPKNPKRGRDIATEAECPHEAWEQHPFQLADQSWAASRRCNDCGEPLPTISLDGPPEGHADV
ncbi:hypothetical protein WB388_08805 [Streptomyces brasiliscabiei]|uniref:Uncharacterized protein n=1 Tax=Streptomyces brasiliscabiei TaxID=2736302 RepID=A0ABU8GA65_9ACTN